MRHHFTGQLKTLVDKAQSGTVKEIDFIMDKLTIDSTLAMTRYVDFALSLVEAQEGIDRIQHYLFNGSQIQRNYAALYFNRIGEWKYVKRAFDLRLIDEIQAFSR